MGENGLSVLVVDDERSIRRFLSKVLAAHEYEVITARNGEEAITRAATMNPDLVILDLGLPDISGVAVASRLREWSDVPIVVLSVKEREADKVRALDAGADDYLTKPFGVHELLARLRAVMRRISEGEQDPVFRSGDLVVDVSRRIVELEGEEVQLTPTEYDLLTLLVRHAGKVITRGDLLRKIWGPGYQNDYHLLRVNISNLRSKIEPEPAHPRYILTEPGVGYRLKPYD